MYSGPLNNLFIAEASPSNGISLEQIHTNVKDQGMDSLAHLLISILTSFNSATRLRALEEDNRTLTLAVRSFSEDIVKLRCNTASHVRIKVLLIIFRVLIV